MAVSVGQVERYARIKREMNRRKNETFRKYVPLPHVLPFHKSTAQFRIGRGGNRGGKTTAGAWEVVAFALHAHPYLETPPNARILCIANKWSKIGDTIAPKLFNKGGVKLEGLGAESPPLLPSRYVKEIAWNDKRKGEPSRVKVVNGDNVTIIEFKSVESGRENFESAEYDFVWWDEEPQDQQVFQEVIRSLIDRKGKFICTATPVARGWILPDLHDLGKQTGCVMTIDEFVLPTFDNPYIAEGQVRVFQAWLEQRGDDDMLNTRLKGDYLTLSGLVYGEWNPEIHELPPEWRTTMSQQWPVCVTIDPGTDDPCAVLWDVAVPTKAGGRRIVAFREYYQRLKTVREVVTAIREMSEGLPLIRAYIGHDSVKRSQHNAQKTIFDEFRDEFKKQGVKSALTGNPIIPWVAEREIMSGINNVKEFLLVREDGMPGFQATSDLVHFKWELKRYMWDPEPDKRNRSYKPRDKHNHLMDAWRYRLASIGPPNLKIKPPMVESERLLREFNAYKLKARKQSWRWQLEAEGVRV